MDLFYLVLTFAFFASTWGLLRVCERLMGGES